MPKRSALDQSQDSPESPPTNRRKLASGYHTTSGFTPANSSPFWTASPPANVGLTEDAQKPFHLKDRDSHVVQDIHNDSEQGEGALRELPVNTQRPKKSSTGRPAKRRKKKGNEPSPPFCGIKRPSSDTATEECGRDRSAQTFIDQLPVTKPGLSTRDHAPHESIKDAPCHPREVPRAFKDESMPDLHYVKNASNDLSKAEYREEKRFKHSNEIQQTNELDQNKAAESPAIGSNVDTPDKRASRVLNTAVDDLSCGYAVVGRKDEDRVQPHKPRSERVPSDGFSDTDLLSSVQNIGGARDLEQAPQEHENLGLSFSYGLPDADLIPSTAGSTGDTYINDSGEYHLLDQPLLKSTKPHIIRYDPDVGLVFCENDPASHESVDGHVRTDKVQEEETGQDPHPGLDEYEDNLKDDDLLDLMLIRKANDPQQNTERHETQDEFGSDVSFSDIPSRRSNEENYNDGAFGCNDRETMDDLELLDELVELDEFELDGGNLFVKDAVTAQNSMAKDTNGGAANEITEELAEEKSRHPSEAKENNTNLSAVHLPIVRPPFPASVEDRSTVIGLSPNSVLRTCFRIGEALNVGCTAFRLGHNVVIELYACVISSSRDIEEGKQYFELSDIYHRERPPYLKASYEGWKGVELYESETAVFLGDGSNKMCRCLGRIVKDNGWMLEMMSIWEADWEDIEYVRGIVCS